ncbi:hypothetical protein AB5J49_24290 [Streptomyces sp. R28]|uniref:Uncharacterized protein n=1 Tax=Streptomyces sp. R28 TaxID=3238628 RepID=A0AB39PYS9_9ACTN
MTLTFHSFQLPALIAVGVFAALYAGVVLPAVWSRKSTRRQAALKVLTQILGVVRRWRK